MYPLLLSIAAQSTCLASLCWSGHEYWYLAWYVPNWVASALILAPSISPEAGTLAFFRGLVFAVCFVNLSVTAAFLQEPWVLSAPTVVSVILAIALDIYQGGVLKAEVERKLV